MSDRVRIFGTTIDPLTRQAAVERILALASRDEVGFSYVVTPNVDHVLNLEKDSAFRTTYEGAALVVVDGKPLWWASRLLGAGIPETVPGSDLVPMLFGAIDDRGADLPVFLLGAGPGVAELARQKMAIRWPKVRVCGIYSPPMGFEHDAKACREIEAMINDSGARIVIVGLGSPKQEKWASSSANQLTRGVGVCAGATIDFLAENKVRAPRWMRAAGLEWLYRAISEPRRLGPRYARGLILFPLLLLREFFRARRDS